MSRRRRRGGMRVGVRRRRGRGRRVRAYHGSRGGIRL